MNDGDGASCFLDGSLRTLGCCVDGERNFLRDGAAAEKLYRSASANDAKSLECCDIIRTCGNTLLEDIEIERFHGDAARMDEATELRLTTDERRLTSFESSAAALADTRLLTFLSAASGGSGASAIATCNAVALARGSAVWLESV